MILVLFLFMPLLQAAQPPATSSYVPQRVYDTHKKAFTDFETMLADLGRAAVVFVGEQHDDRNTHRLELAMLEGLKRRRTPLVVAMEMFERDVQPAIDRYASGESTEEEFLRAARPWPRYATDYRPSVEFARANQIPIVASNVPRRIASDVAKAGMSALDSLSDARRLAAAEIRCPAKGDYYDRFLASMREHPSRGSAIPPSADSNRFYLAQCVKDETMGESVAETLRTARDARTAIVHINGSFHTDFGQGTVESTRRRLPGRRVIVLSILPVDDLDAARPVKEDRKRADYLVYTTKQSGN